jgi:hypothetical protein
MVLMLGSYLELQSPEDSVMGSPPARLARCHQFSQVGNDSRNFRCFAPGGHRVSFPGIHSRTEASGRIWPLSGILETLRSRAGDSRPQVAPCQRQIELRKSLEMDPTLLAKNDPAPLMTRYGLPASKSLCHWAVDRDCRSKQSYGSLARFSVSHDSLGAHKVLLSRPSSVARYWCTKGTTPRPAKGEET